MNRNIVISILLLVAFCLTSTVNVMAKSEWKKKKTEKVESQELTKYEKLFKDKKVITAEGLFTLRQVNGKVYFEFPKTLLSREFLLGSTIVEISDNGNGLVGQMPYEPMHVTFTLRDSTLQMCIVELLANGQTPIYTDSKDENTREAIRKSSAPAIINTFKVETYTPDSSAVVVDMTAFFTEHRDEMNPFWGPSKRTVEYGRASRAVKFKKELSKIDTIKAFENNVSVVTTLNYDQDIVVGGEYLVAKDEPVTAKLNRTLMILPEEKDIMWPRLADPRVNINTIARMNMNTKVDRAMKTHYMTRWNLQPKDMEAYKRGELVELIKPIVFYIDNLFPQGWSEYITAGVLEWNKAFEAIGFKNAIQVKPFPKDDPNFDPDNIAFNCIRYAPTSIYSTVSGPLWADPRSGEIMTASLFIFHDVLSQINYGRFIQTASNDARARNMKLPLEVFGEGLKAMVANNTGTMLGFLCNAAASNAYPTDSLRSASFTQQYGISPSIMDELGYNYVAQPEDKNVVLVQSKIGPADYYTVQVAYQPNPEATTQEADYEIVKKWIAEKAGDPIFRYGKRQRLLTTFDPTALPNDLGDDALKASTYGIKNLKYILENMNDWLDSQDVDFEYRNVLYRYLVYHFEQYLFNVYINIGGFKLNEHFVGDAMPSFIPLSKDLQKRSLAFVMNELKNMDWIDNYNVTKNLAFDGSQARRILQTYLIRMQNVTTELFITKRLSLVAYRDKDNYTPKEYLEDLYAYIWDSTIKGRNVTEAERIMQNEFIRRTRDLVDFNGKKDPFGQVYATTPQIPSEEEILRQIKQMRNVEIPTEMRFVDNALKTNLTAGFGSRWLVENIAVDNTNHLWNALYGKVIKLINQRKGTGNIETQAHYDYLLYLINRSLKKAPKW